MKHTNGYYIMPLLQWISYTETFATDKQKEIKWDCFFGVKNYLHKSAESLLQSHHQDLLMDDDVKLSDWFNYILLVNASCEKTAELSLSI